MNTFTILVKIMDEKLKEIVQNIYTNKFSNKKGYFQYITDEKKLIIKKDYIRDRIYEGVFVNISLGIAGRDYKTFINLFIDEKFEYGLFHYSYDNSLNIKDNFRKRDIEKDLFIRFEFVKLPNERDDFLFNEIPEELCNAVENEIVKFINEYKPTDKDIIVW